MGLLGNLKLVSLAMAKPCTTACANNAPTCHIGAARTVEGGIILTHTHCYFCGLRCSSLHVIKLLKAYVKEDQSKVPYVANLVQATHSSKKQAMHFIEAMRDMESRAGTLCAATLKLSGNVECDGTSLGKFYVGQGCVRFQKEILNIQQKKRSMQEGHHRSRFACISNVSALFNELDQPCCISAVREPLD